MKVNVIRRNKRAVLVEWVVGGIPHRGSVPSTEVHGSQVADYVLDMAVPYGLPWSELIEMQTTPEEVERQLHLRGIWTSEDVLENPSGVQSAIQAAYKIDAATLMRLARERRAG